MFKWKSGKEDDGEDLYEEDVYKNNDAFPKDTYYRVQIHTNSSLKKESERNRLMFLLKEKETIKTKLFTNHQIYSDIEKVFLKEIYIAEKNEDNFWFLFCYYFGFGFGFGSGSIPDLDIFTEDNLL